ncbi:alpha/beta hydrolase fold domain-containing protein [Amycolatopsis saalfeldensis]|uniref:alpha/beta hydrolase fold domain-containing protein n=1 Tax=Amycolatopsis saalfeldensis TaxID=394193 RepID=UPI00116037BF
MDRLRRRSAHHHRGRGVVLAQLLPRRSRSSRSPGRPGGRHLAAVDPLRDGAEAFARRLREGGGQATVLRYEGVFHGFLTEIGTFAAAVSEAAHFLESILTA